MSYYHAFPRAYRAMGRGRLSLDYSGMPAGIGTGSLSSGGRGYGGWFGGGYGRRRYPGRRYYRARRSRAITYSTLGPALTAMYGVREKKLVQTQAAGETITTTLTNATVKYVNGIALGDDINNRDGRRFRWISFQAKGCFLMDVSVSMTPMTVRMMLVVDKQPNSAAFALADLLQNTSYPTFSGINSSYADRFYVLHDKLYTIQASNTATADCQVTYSLYKRMKVDTNYSDTGATIASCGTNAVYWIILGDTTSANVFHTFWYRMRGYDVL